MIWRPSIDEERRVLISGRARAWARSGLVQSEAADRIREAMKTRWKPSSLFSRLVFFILTLVCVGAFRGLLELTHVPAGGLVTTVVCVGIAEFLILNRRFFHIGPEEALYLGGLAAPVWDLPAPDDEKSLLLAIAAAIAGFRVLNDLFFTLAAVLLGIYFAGKADNGDIAALYCVTLAIISFFLLTRRIARPLWDRTLSSMVFVLPPAAFLFWNVHPLRRGGMETAALLAFAAVAIVLMLAGLKRRLHSAITSGLVLLALVLAQSSAGLTWRTEAKLLFWGAIALAVALIAERLLREPRRGMTSRPLIESESLDLIEAAGLAMLPPPATPPAEPGGGGEFGGAGASGHY